VTAAVSGAEAGAGVLAALSWEPQIKGGLYVLLAVVILVGSAYLILSTDVGSRLGFQLTAAGLFGFLTTIGIVWWVYAIGPVGRLPTWELETVVIGDVAASRSSVLTGFPRGWEQLEVSDPDVADAQPVVDAVLTSRDRDLFQSPADYLPIAAYQTGGRDYGPFGLDFRPFDVFHTPHYILVQVQEVVHVEPVEGLPPPRPEPDPTKPPVTVLMIRDLGSERLNPAVFTISSALIFGLLVYQLHVRDKVAAARNT
jgi:hypothetical protein